MFILRLIESTREYGKGLSWIFRVIPSFAFGDGVLNTSSRSLYAIINGVKEAPTAFEMDIAGGDLLFLFIFGTFYFCLLFAMESAGSSNLLNKFLKRETAVAYIPKEYDDDV
jgi:hypothetical protein